MKTTNKRILSFVMAMVMALSLAVSASAAEVTTPSEDEAVSELIDGDNVSLLMGTTTTSASNAKSHPFSFHILIPIVKWKLYTVLSVSKPCTLYIRLYDKNGTSSLGTTTFTFTQSDNEFTILLSPTSGVTGGSYVLKIWSDTEGVGYIGHIEVG